MKRMTWFHCYPEKWLAALAGMSAVKQHVYLIVCFRIYEKRGPIPDTISAIAKRCGYDRCNHVKRAINELVKEGKLFRVEEGLMNPFAANEMAMRRDAKHASSSGLSSEKIEENQRIFSLEIEEDIERKKERVRGRRAPRHPMPQDWEPDTAGVDFAKGKGFTETRIRQLVIACRDYHLRNGTLIAGPVGLAATWRTWCTNEIKFTAERQARYGNRSFSPQETRGDTILAASREFAAEMARDRAGEEIPERGNPAADERRAVEYFPPDQRH